MAFQSDTLIQLAQFGLINAYLVREDDGFTLVDTMTARQDGRLLKAAAAAGAPIRRILLTHAHPDHAGSVDRLVAQLPGVELIVGTRESKTLASRPRREPGEPKGLLLPQSGGVKSVPTRLIDDGDTVGSLQVHAAPGHSVGQLAFLDGRDGTLICGDAYSTVGGVATTARRYWKFPLPGTFTWHRPTALETARRLRALDPARLAPGHGPVVEAPVAAMDTAIARGD